MAGTVLDLLQHLRTTSTTNRELGTRFERLMVTYLKSDPQWTEQFSEVWMWADSPLAEANATDTGIDLVALDIETGGYCAVQCKFYEPDHTVAKADIDSFFTASGRAGITRRMIISTTEKWGPNAEAALADQQIPVTRIGMAALESSPIDWEKVADDAVWQRGMALDSSYLHAKKTLRPHQEAAVDAVFDGFAAHDRGKLIMACGTGKTFTSLKIAERLAHERAESGEGDRTNVLFLVPSIALLSQTLREWTAETETSMRSFAVCSDAKVSKKATAADYGDTAAYELAFPATTSPEKLIGQFRRVADESGLTVVFSTYQSLPTVSAAQRAGLGSFDLVLCDEAHRTTGVTLAGDDESNFVRVHDDGHIAADRRLYMTATPKIFTESTKTDAKSASAKLCSMDDESLFGPEFHRLGFGSAVEAGLLTDYKVLVLTVDEGYAAAALQQQLADENMELNLADAAKTSAAGTAWPSGPGRRSKRRVSPSASNPESRRCGGPSRSRRTSRPPSGSPRPSPRSWPGSTRPTPTGSNARSADKASGIVNDPNEWSDDPRYIVDLLKRIVTVSLETMKIVDGLPPLDILPEQ